MLFEFLIVFDLKDFQSPVSKVEVVRADQESTTDDVPLDISYKHFSRFQSAYKVGF